MSSAIDATKPADNVLSDKADQRNNWQAAKDEIEDLQVQVSTPRRMAYDTTQFKQV